jgi:hypothetical protein
MEVGRTGTAAPTSAAIPPTSHPSYRSTSQSRVDAYGQLTPPPIPVSPTPELQALADGAQDVRVIGRLLE